VWVCALWHVWRGLVRSPHQCQADEFGSLGTLQMLFILGTAPGVTECGSWHGFLPVLYQLWMVGVATRHLEVLIWSSRTRLTWWGPCVMESKEGFPLVCLWYIYIYIYDYFIVSSPYLLVFGDDRVCGTREQMMLQVDLVRHRVGTGLAWEILFRVFIVFELVVNFYIMRLWYFN